MNEARKRRLKAIAVLAAIPFVGALAMKLGHLALEARGVAKLSPAERVEYLDAIPRDPFSPSGGRILFNGERFYSVGPDGVDEGAATIYDPKNGAASGGDVILTRAYYLPAPIDNPPPE
jgi:hypothetical protein